MFGPARGSHWRVLFAAVFVSVSLTVEPAQGADPVDPIVGTWQYGDGQEVQISGANGSYIGIVTKPINFDYCIHPVGRQLWSMTGSGGSYTGTYIGGEYTGGGYGPCKIRPEPVTFEVVSCGVNCSAPQGTPILIIYWLGGHGNSMSKIIPPPAVESVSAKKLASGTAKLAVPKGATVTLRVAPGSSEFCSVSTTKSGTFLNYLKDGLCKVTVIVNTKFNKKYSKTVIMTVRG